jgi:hypothetical protein
MNNIVNKKARKPQRLHKAKNLFAFFVIYSPYKKKTAKTQKKFFIKKKNKRLRIKTTIIKKKADI